MPPNGTYEWSLQQLERRSEYSCTSLALGSKALFSAFAGGNVMKAVWHLKPEAVELEFAERFYWYV